MKIGIIADSHDHKENIRAAVEWFNREKVGLVLNAGDLVAPFTIREYEKLDARMICVFGNNDGERLGLAGRFDIHRHPHVVEAGGMKILMLHEPDNLESVAKNNDFDVIIYGHTHEQDIRDVGKTKVINPGECCAWLTGIGTVAILETENRKVTIKKL